MGPAWNLTLLAFMLLFQQSHAARPAQAQFHISGTLVNAVDGGAIPQAQVTIAFHADQSTEQHVFTDEAGGFSFGHLDAGKYSLTAKRRGFFEQAYLQHGAYTTSIVVGPDLDSDNIVFPIFPDASLSGEITDESGEPVRNSQVMLFMRRNDNGKLETTVRDQQSTNDTGEYRFSHLDPGMYFVAASAQPWYAQNSPIHSHSRIRIQVTSEPDQDREENLDVAYPVTFFPNVTDSSEAEAISLKPGDRAEADIQLLPVHAVHLTIKDPNENTASRFGGVQVSRTLFNSFKFQVPAPITITGKGTTEVDGLAPGQYEFQISSGLAGDIISETRDLSLANDTAIDVREDAASSRISGVVKSEGASAALNHTSVTIENLGTDDAQAAIVSSDGKFDFANYQFSGGRYQISIGSTDNLVLRSLSATGARVSGENIEMNGADDVRLTLSLSPAVPSVAGFALRDGKPAAGVMVVLVPPDPENNRSLFRRDQTDSDGSFSLATVVPGKYTVVAIADGWNLEWANPVVIAKYIPGGVAVKAQTEGEYKLRVNVQ